MTILRNIKIFIKRFSISFYIFNAIIGKNKKRIMPGNKIDFNRSTLKNTSIEIYGKGNRVFIGDFCKLKGCSIIIHGNNSTIYISGENRIDSTSIFMADSENKIYIGKRTSFSEGSALFALESTSLTIGEDCMFSYDTHIRTSDSHSIVNLSGERINYAKDVCIGNHVWVGANAVCLKGTVVKDNCIIGAGSILTKEYPEENCIIAGVPAKIIKSKINWVKERI